jgi:hypothetical protein
VRDREREERIRDQAGLRPGDGQQLTRLQQDEVAVAAEWDAQREIDSGAP